jgi:folate-dependent phosphoribosylglycinamide formyltransferase PurN
MSVKIILTAGFSRAKHVLALAELLARDGVLIGGVLVVSPYTFKRLRSMVRTRGWSFIGGAARRIMGIRSVSAKSGSSNDPLEAYLKANQIPSMSLREWARRHRVPYLDVASLNSPQALAFVKNVAPDGVIYGGGGVLGKSFINAAHRKVMNAHSGPLPQVRGMNACEWSLLLGLRPTVTIHFIDEGVDTGPSIEAIPVPVEHDDDIERLRSKCTVAGIAGLRRSVFEVTVRAAGPFNVSEVRTRQCYVLAPALQALLERKLASGVYVA